MKTICAFVALAMVSVISGCSAAAGGGGDGPLDSSEGELRSSHTVHHGTIKVGFQGAEDPGSSFSDPWARDGDGAWADLCVPATLDTESPAHTWDIEVTDDDVDLSLRTESIRLFQSGKPDIKNIAVRYLVPSDYPVKDVDTKMKLFKKEGDSFTFVASNDDGLDRGKGSYIDRAVAKKGVTFRVVVTGKTTSTKGDIGLFVGGKPEHPSDP